jgi:ABC-type dipeptide/oligopeptide/nickel transport system permease subunit
MRAAWGRYRGNRSAVWAAVGLGALILFCLVAPPLSPYDPYAVDFSQKLETPTPRHLLGTDLFGRDLLERMALGGRTTMFIALMATGIILVLGLLYGAVSGLAGRKVDDLMMRIVDGLFAIPRLPWVLIVLVLIGANGSIFTVILALSLFSWMTTARLVRSQILALKQNDFVRAARAPGGPSPPHLPAPSRAEYVWGLACRGPPRASRHHPRRGVRLRAGPRDQRTRGDLGEHRPGRTES